jgi:hypothetical protein
MVKASVVVPKRLIDAAPNRLPMPGGATPVSAAEFEFNEPGVPPQVKLNLTQLFVCAR